jgi:hypothetical protein|nr:MAG TPA: hypothetical protein [Caudoviricetes sp.]
MTKWFTQEGMNEIMSLKGIDRIRLLFDEVFPKVLPVENATYGRLNKDRSIAMLTIKVKDDVTVEAVGGNDSLTICGISFNWPAFCGAFIGDVNRLGENEREALRNLWAYADALNKAYSLILARHQAIGYDALDRIHRVLMVVERALGSHLKLDGVDRDAYAEIRRLTTKWSIHDQCLFERVLGRYVINDFGVAMHELNPKNTVAVLAVIREHDTNNEAIVIEDRVTDSKPILKVLSVGTSYAYINGQLTNLIEKCELDASKVMKDMTDATKGMMLIHLFQKYVDIVGKHPDLSKIKNRMVRHFECDHLSLIKPTLVRISEKASRLATEVKP